MSKFLGLWNMLSKATMQVVKIAGEPVTEPVKVVKKIVKK